MSDPYRAALESLLGEFERVAQRWLLLPRVAARLAAFASTDNGRGLRLPSLVWLARAAAEFEGDAWEDDSLSDSLIRFVRTVWDRERSSVVPQSAHRDAFLRLLTVIAARGGSAAQALRDNVVDSLAVIPA